MKILPIPEDFSLNEWFVIISIIVSYLLFFFLRRNFPLSITILIVLFAVTIARFSDRVLADPLLDFYDLMDSGKYELFDILSYLLYGPFVYVFLYIYQKLNIKGIYTLFYVVAWSIAAVVYEWITVLVGLFTFKEWSSIYSFPIYMFVQSLTILFYHYLGNRGQFL